MENQVKHEQDARRYVILVDGEPAGQVDYVDEGQVRRMTHTEILPEFAGEGYAGELVRQALDDTRAAGMTVKPECSYVAHYLDKHEEYADLRA